MHEKQAGAARQRSLIEKKPWACPRLSTLSMRETSSGNPLIPGETEFTTNLGPES